MMPPKILGRRTRWPSGGLPELGDLRGRSADVATCINAFWENLSFHNYADCAMGEKFRIGLKKLLDLGSRSRCVILCAEAVWWRCHRRIIADYLLASGSPVFHILGRGRIEQAGHYAGGYSRFDGNS
jgi:uncharacterized protein (DUF488 family)